MSIEILGKAALLRQFASLAKNVDNGATEGLQKVGAMIGGDAKRIITHKNIVDTGRLLGSMTWSIDGKQYGYEPVGESENTDQVDRNTSNNEVIIGTNVEYAAAQEFGSVKGIQARPYLSVAFNSNKGNIIDILGKEVETSITKKVIL